MKKRTSEQWQVLISDYEASGLTIRGFCKEQGICRKHFGQRRQLLFKKTNLNAASTFVPVKVPASHVKPTLELVQKNCVVLKIPLSVSPVWLAEFIQQLGN